MKERGVYVLPDGIEITGDYRGSERRFVASASGWKKLTEWGRANVRFCEIEECHFGSEWHHLGRGRGNGGCWRDDRIEIDGKRNMIFVCRGHHQILEEERRRARS